MTKYVALLRGINVGGNAKVEMAKLKDVFESIGCDNVSTYINSGNVIFSDTRSPKNLTEMIESTLLKKFGLQLRIVLRNQANIEVLCQKIPADWSNDLKQRTDVLFLWEEIDNADILKKISIKPEIENAIYLPGAVVWNIGRQNVRRGVGVKLIKTQYYKHMTARNINTVRKLRELMAR